MLYPYLQPHNVVYVKYVQLFTCQSYLNKVMLKINFTMRRAENNMGKMVHCWLVQSLQKTICPYHLNMKI